MFRDLLLIFFRRGDFAEKTRSLFARVFPRDFFFPGESLLTREKPKRKKTLQEEEEEEEAQDTRYIYTGGTSRMRGEMYHR